MATRTIPEEHRLFTTRADWREDSQYANDDLSPSMWAWELLRRNAQYAQHYAAWHSRIRDVPPVPFPKMSLEGYFCYPDATPGTTYEQYRAQHPDNLVLPIRDYMRERWGITRLIDPTLHAVDVAKWYPHNHSKLAWLFACNTPDILNPPTRWPEKSYITHFSLSMLTSGFCTGTEIMVRLDFTGNFEAQMESLRQKIGAFFDGGTRAGSTVVPRQDLAPTEGTGEQPTPVLLDSECLQAFLAVRRDWNTTPIYLKSLRYVVRMADVIASLEAGTLVEQISEKRGSFPSVDISDVDLSLDPDRARIPLFYIEEHKRVRNALRTALLRYFKWHTLGHEEATSGRFDDWLNQAYQMVSGGHTLVARMGSSRSATRKKQAPD